MPFCILLEPLVAHGSSSSSILGVSLFARLDVQMGRSKEWPGMWGIIGGRVDQRWGPAILPVVKEIPVKFAGYESSLWPMVQMSDLSGFPSDLELKLLPISATLDCSSILKEGRDTRVLGAKKQSQLRSNCVARFLRNSFPGWHLARQQIPGIVGHT